MGRYYVTEVSLLSLNLNLAVSYKVNDWRSVGTGGNVAYAMMDYTLKLSNLSDPMSGDGELKLDNLHDFAGGWNLGVLSEPWDGTRIGLTYRSPRVEGKFATGFKYELSENTVLGVSYLYADLGSVPVDFTAIGGHLKGDYKRNDLHMVGFSLNWKTGKPI